MISRSPQNLNPEIFCPTGGERLGPVVVLKFHAAQTPVVTHADWGRAGYYDKRS